MQITQTQLEQFTADICRGRTARSRPAVMEALEKIGVTVEPTNVERAVDRATVLIREGRSVELRAALRLLGRERVGQCTEDEAARLLRHFDPLSFD